jgi:cytoskeletal protein RodZ
LIFRSLVNLSLCVGRDRNPAAKRACPVGSFGERLQREREKRKMTLDDVAVATKIGTRLLSALEQEKFDQLPGGIFNKGFVRAYARHLGLNEEQAVADYLAASGEGTRSKPETQELQAIAERKERERRGKPTELPWGTMAALLLVVALALAVWNFYTREKSQNNRSHAPVVPRQPSSSAAPTAGSAAASTDLTGESPTQAAIVLLVKANEDSWISITADDRAIYNDTLVAPAEKSVEARKQIILKAGNMGGLEISVNGRKLPPQGEEGEVKTLIFGLAEPETPPSPPSH